MIRVSETEFKTLIKGYTKELKAKQPRLPKAPSKGEETLSRQLYMQGIPYEREYQFCPSRQWKSDFLICGPNLLVEIEGGIYSHGRHTRGAGFINDMKKYNTASILGFPLLRYSTDQVETGIAIREIAELYKKWMTK